MHYSGAPNSFFYRNKRISNHAQICCDEKRWCPEFVGHTPSICPTVFLSMKIFFGSYECGHFINTIQQCSKEFLIETRGYPTMHRFVVMRRDDVQSLVATPPLYVQLCPLV